MNQPDIPKTPEKSYDQKLRDKAWNQGKIVWIASYKGRKSRVVSGKALPSWIYEYADKVKWKIIEGTEWL